MMVVLIYFLIFTHNYVFCDDLTQPQYAALPKLTPSANEQELDDANLKVQPNPIVGQMEQKPQIENAIEIQYEEQKPCYETKILMNVVIMLVKLISQDPSYSEKVAMIINVLKEQLKNSQKSAQNDEVYDQLLNLEGKLSQSSNIIVDKEILRAKMNHEIEPKVKINTKIIFKYQIPSLNQPQCKQAFLKLLHTAYETYINISKFPMCKDVEEYQYNYPHSESLHMLYQPNPLSYSVGAPDGDTVTNVFGTKYNNYGSNDFHNTYLPNQGIGYVNPHNQSPYKLPPNAYDPQDKQSYINNLLPKYSKNVFIISDINKPKPENIQEANPNKIHPGATNIYEILQLGDKIHPENNGIDRPINDKVLNIGYQNINHQSFNKDSLKPSENNWKVPSMYENLQPNKSTNPLDYMLEMALYTKQFEDQVASINNKSPIINIDYNKLAGNEKNPPLPAKTDEWAPNNNIPYQNNNFKLLPNLPQNVVYLITKFPHLKEYILKKYGIVNNYNLQNITPSNSINMNDYYKFLYQTLPTMPNLYKLNSSVNKPGVIELTYVLKRTKPLIYQPLYFVKYRLPYSMFLENAKNILQEKPYLKAYPVKLYQELITHSNVSEISPDLKGFPKEDILQLTYNNGHLVKAQVLADNENLNKQFQAIHNLNSDIDAGEILNLNKNITKENYLKSFKAIPDNANDVIARPVELQKRYKMINNVPLFGHNTYYPYKQSLNNPEYLKQDLPPSNLLGDSNNLNLLPYQQEEQGAGLKQ